MSSAARPARRATTQVRARAGTASRRHDSRVRRHPTNHKKRSAPALRGSHALQEPDRAFPTTTTPSAEQEAGKFHNKVKLWFKDLDDTYQDVLDRARVEKLLGILHDDHGELTPPRAVEVDWVMRKNALSSPDSMTLEECETAVHTYKSYLKRRPEIERAFAEYDADGDDFLNRAELSQYIAFELNAEGCAQRQGDGLADGARRRRGGFLGRERWAHRPHGDHARQGRVVPDARIHRKRREFREPTPGARRRRCSWWRATTANPSRKKGAAS